MPGDQLRIREAVAADEAAARSCAREAFSKYVDRIGKEPASINADFGRQISEGQVSVAVRLDEFLGYAVFYAEGDHLHLGNLAVWPEHSGRGIGRKLIEFVERRAAEEDLSAIELYKNEVMTENLSMYPRLGYCENARKRQDGFNRVFSRKDL